MRYPLQPILESSSYYTQYFFRDHGIDLGLIYRFEIKPEASLPVVVVPDNSVDLVFHCNINDPGACFYGMTSKAWSPPRHIPGERYVGVRFNSDRLLGVTGYLEKDFLAQAIDFNLVAKSRDCWVERICFEQDPVKQMRLLEEFLKKSYDPQKEMPPLVWFCYRHIVDTAGQISVAELSQQSGYSQRYVLKCFKDYYGVGIKLFSRIVRFQYTMSMVRSSKVGFAHIAAEMGYTDQAHMTHEFQLFSPLTPKKIMEIGF